MDDQQGRLEGRLKIVSKQCYGYGFGCSIDAKVKLGSGDSSSIPEDATIEVTYKIKGAKDGPVVGFHDGDESGRVRHQYRVPRDPITQLQAHRRCGLR